ncbi:MAG: hypothetical protein AAF799_47040 [Myxococcota bacterium]
MKVSTLLTLALLTCSSAACGLDQTLELGDEIQVRHAVNRAHRMHEQEPPPVVLLRHAMREGDLLEDAQMQAALDQVQEAHDLSRRCRAALRRELAEAVNSRDVRAEAFAKRISAVAANAHGEATALVHALNVAHGLLAPATRQAVVDALQHQRPAEPDAEGRHHPPPPPRHANGLIDTLELDRQQHRALRNALGRPPRPMPPHWPELLVFVRDDFDANQLGIEDAHRRNGTFEATFEVELVAALVSIVDDDQLATLRDLLHGESPDPNRSVHG